MERVRAVIRWPFTLAFELAEEPRYSYFLQCSSRVPPGLRHRRCVASLYVRLLWSAMEHG